jgi:hypothetical protein
MPWLPPTSTSALSPLSSTMLFLTLLFFRPMELYWHTQIIQENLPIFILVN